MDINQIFAAVIVGYITATFAILWGIWHVHKRSE